MQYLVQRKTQTDREYRVFYKVKNNLSTNKPFRSGIDLMDLESAIHLEKRTQKIQRHSTLAEITNSHIPPAIQLASQLGSAKKRSLPYPSYLKINK